MNGFLLFCQRFFILLCITYSLHKLVSPFIYAKNFVLSDLLYWNVQVDIFQVAFCSLSLVWLLMVSNMYKNWHWISFLGGFTCVVYMGWFGFLGAYICLPLIIIFSIQIKMYMFFKKR